MTNVTEDEDRSKMGTPEPGPARRRRGINAGNANAVGKIRHLKKDDGEPLWRVDIQYDFLKAVFDDPSLVFTNSWETHKPKQNFADLYIDTMSRSSKTSKVLRDKLLSDREAAKNMAMVCLLVNIGRMNTTLNCEILSPTACRPVCVADLCFCSFSRDEGAAANIPCHSFPPSSTRSKLVQTAPGCPPTQIHLEGRFGRSPGTTVFGRHQSYEHSTN